MALLELRPQHHNVYTGSIVQYGTCTGSRAHPPPILRWDTAVSGHVTSALQLREDFFEGLGQYLLRLFDARPADPQTFGLVGLGDDMEMHMEDVLVRDLAIVLIGELVSVRITKWTVRKPTWRML